MLLHAIVFSCGFEACTEVNYQVSVSIQTFGARRCSLRYVAEVPYEERLTLAVVV